MNYRYIGGLFLFVVSTYSTRTVRAATLWDNGGPAVSNQGGSAMTDNIQAEDFDLSALSNITGIRFWNLQGVPADYWGTIEWQILDDAGGTPGTNVIGSGSATPTQVADGTVLGFSQFQMDFSTAVFNVAAGTYWLALHNGPTSNSDFTDFYLAWTDFNATNTATSRGQELSLAPLGSAFTTNDQEHAFAIFGDILAPEPGSIVLMLAGAAALALRHWSRS